MSSCAWCEAHFLSVNKMQRGTARREGGAAYGQARQDRLNKLPDDILLNILERLDTLDALKGLHPL
jgi:hypothetical protein